MKLKKYTKLLSVVILALFCSEQLYSQDYHFSQFRETPLLINPAQTALNNDIRVIMNYKNQWSSVTTPFKSYGLSGEFALNRKRGSSGYFGVGLQLLSDKAGTTKVGSNLALVSLSRIVQVADYNKLSVGVIGGIGQRVANTSSFQWGSQYDVSSYSYNGAIPSGEDAVANSYTFPDLGAGIAWNYGKGEKYISANDGIKATVGFSAYHFGIPTYSYFLNTNEKLDTKFIGHGTMSIGISNSNLIIIPEFIYVKQGASQEINVGSLFKYITQEDSKYTLNKRASAYAVGANYRVGDALIFTATYEYSNYAIGISYDINLSKLSVASKSNGGFEISLRFVTPGQFSSSRSRI